MMNRKGNVIEFMNQHFPQIFPVKTSLLKLEKLIRSSDYPVTNGIVSYLPNIRFDRVFTIPMTYAHINRINVIVE